MQNLKFFMTVAAAICLSSSIAWSQQPAQERARPEQENQENLPPPELTEVSGKLMVAPDEPTTGGVAYFIFQRRLMEIPHENPLEKIRAMREATAEVDRDGSFTLTMQPGNFALVFEPGVEAEEELFEPGEESMAAARQRLTPDQIRDRIAVIRENAQRGLPIENGKIGDAYIVENRIVRPPLVAFGEMVLGQDNSATILATNEDKKPIDFPATLRLRGKSGDIYEPHPPSVSKPGEFTFHNLFPQSYEVFGLPTRPREGKEDEATTPTIKNAMFMFEGEPVEHTVVVISGGEESDSQQEPPEGDRRRNDRR